MEKRTSVHLVKALAIIGFVFAFAYRIHAQSAPTHDTATTVDDSLVASEILNTPSPSDAAIVNAVSPSATATPASVSAIQGKNRLLYASSDNGTTAAIGWLPLSDQATQLTSDFTNDKYRSFTKELYLSPNRQLLAVTMEQAGSDAEPLTYISNVDGEELTAPHFGSFTSWAPDSSKVLLFRSDIDSQSGRRIYYLDLNDAYADSGLPDGVISADISSVDGSIVYAVATGVTDNTDIYRRDPSGTDTPLLKGQQNIFTWLRFAPDGKKIAFMKGNLYNQPQDQSVWAMNPDGTEALKISDIIWNYPPVWSPVGSRLLFVAEDWSNVREYDTATKALKQVTNFSNGDVEHPNYSADGQTVIFSSESSGERQIWTAKNGTATQLTNGGQQKEYPIMP